MEKNKLYLVILVLIILLGLMLRIYHLGVPFAGFHAVKEAQFADMAQHFQKGGNYFIPETSFEGVNTNVFLPGWFIMWSWNIFGNYEWAARLPFLIMGVLSLFLIYLIGKNLYSKRVGLIAAFFLAISPMAAYFSRNAQGESPLVFFSLLTVYLFLLFYRTHKKVYFFLSAVSLLLAAMSKYLALFLFLPLGWHMFKTRKERILDIKDYIFYLVIPIIPTFIFMHYVKLATLSASFYSNYDFLSAGLTNFSALFNMQAHFYRLVHLVGGTNPLTFMLVILGGYIILKSNKNNQNKDIKQELNKEFSQQINKKSNHYNSDAFVFLWIVGYFLTYLTFLNIATPGNNYYLISFIPPLCLIAAWGTEQIKSKKVSVGLLTLTLIISLAILFIIYSVNYPYKEAGGQVDRLLAEKEMFFRMGDPTVCYYAAHQCYVYDGSGYDLMKVRYEYLLVSRASLTRDMLPNLDSMRYIKDNFVLLQNITGKTILISGNTFRPNKEVEYELIFKRIK